MNSTTQTHPGPPEGGTPYLRPKFWSDGFDLDLLKVFPECERLFATLPDVPIFTFGNTTFARLNHPSVWNVDMGMMAIFSFGPAVANKPATFWTESKIVCCTFEEAMRDCWPHTYIFTLDGRVVWNSWKLQSEFQTILWQVRKWNETSPALLARDRERVWQSIEEATRVFRELADGTNGTRVTRPSELSTNNSQLSTD